MRHSLRLLWIPMAASLSLLGCGGAPTVATGGGPNVVTHGGTLLPLPGQKGHVEILSQADNPKGTANSKGRVVAYYFNDEGSGPPEPAPTGVSFTPEGGKAYPMTRKLDSGTKAARFESELGPFLAGRPLTGELEASIGGQAVKVSVQTR
jgi:hypothetical protein